MREEEDNEESSIEGEDEDWMFQTFNGKKKENGAAKKEKL